VSDAPEGAPVQPNRFFAKVLADQQYEKGRDLEKQGYWERALVSYRRACALDPSNPLYLLARGRICQGHGVEPEAEECYQAVLRLRPGDAVALYNQAQLLAARGRLDAAQENLTQIISGGVEVLGERAAPIFCRLGDIALRVQDYDAAERHYLRALDADPKARYAAASLGALERFAEFTRPAEADGKILPKRAVYAYAGAMVLGFPGDDGLDIPLLPGLGFDSLQELAATLRRFVALARHFRWPVESVVALEPESQPLAIALARALGGRAWAEAELAPRGATTVGVSGTAPDPAAYAARAATLRERSPRSLIYALGLRQPVWEYEPSVNVVSLPVRLEFPWNRGEAAAPEHAEAIGEELAELLLETPADGTLAGQLEWYARHNRLGFDPETMWPAATRIEATA
jgi:tetratricopeptide (TPR) repeat protein